MDNTGNKYTGHASNGSPIQKHSCADYYAMHKIIMVYYPVSRMHVAMIGDRTMAISRNYDMALGAAVIRATAAPVMGGLPVLGRCNGC